MKLEGVLLPVTTPFDRVTGETAPVLFRENLRRWLDAGVHGFVVAGSTGEAPLLDEREVVQLVEWARDVVPPERIVVAGAGAESTRATVRIARAVAEVGADGVLVRPPAYYRAFMDAEVLRVHFEAVADAIPVPLILYNVPRFVPVEITAGLFAELADHPNVAGIKDSSGDLKSLGTLLDAGGAESRVMVGSGSKLYAALEMGAAGGIVAVGCLAPELAVTVYERFQREETGAAGAAQGVLAPLNATVVRDAGVPGVKHALDLLGYAGGPPRPPLLPVNGETGERVRTAVRTAGLLERDGG